MEFVQLTDLHFVPPGERLYGESPQSRLAPAVTMINEDHPRLDAIFVTGDLTERGEAAAYVSLWDVLGELQAETHLLLGNHDNRDVARAHLPSLADDGNGFVQFARRYEGAYCVALDTLEPGIHGGFLCPQRLAWLDRTLSEAPPDIPLLLFQHHPPFAVGLAEMDPIALQNPEEEWEVLASHRRPSHLFFGHVHRPVCGHWRGIPFHAQRGINHQVDFQVTGPQLVEPPESTTVFEDPDYAYVRVTEGQVTVLSRNYLFGR